MFTVDTAQQRAFFGQRHVNVAGHIDMTFEVTKPGENIADAIELTGHGPGTGVVAIGDALQFAGLAGPAVAPLEVLLEVRAVAAWMLVLRLAQIANALVKVLEGA